MKTWAESNSINNKISFNWMRELLAAWKLPTANLSFKPSGIFSTIASKSDGGSPKVCCVSELDSSHEKELSPTVFINERLKRWDLKKKEEKIEKPLRDLHFQLLRDLAWDWLWGPISIPSSNALQCVGLWNTWAQYWDLATATSNFMTGWDRETSGVTTWIIAVNLG